VTLAEKGGDRNNPVTFLFRYFAVATACSGVPALPPSLA
jgi:hypothetical protein